MYLEAGIERKVLENVTAKIIIRLFHLIEVHLLRAKAEPFRYMHFQDGFLLE